MAAESAMSHPLKVRNPWQAFYLGVKGMTIDEHGDAARAINFGTGCVWVRGYPLASIHTLVHGRCRLRVSDPGGEAGHVFCCKQQSPSFVFNFNGDANRRRKRCWMLDTKYLVPVLLLLFVVFFVLF